MDIIRGLQESMPGQGVAAMVITPGADLRYVGGYDAKPLERLTALVIPVKGSAFMVAPALEAQEAHSSAFGAAGGEVITWGETEDPFAIVASRISAMPAGSVAVDDHMWAERVLRLRSLLPDREQVPAGSLLRGRRLVKTDSEIEYLAQAAAAIMAASSEGMR